MLGGQGDLAFFSDNLREKYAALADDSSKSEKKREAAMMMSVAEGQLTEDADEALTSAKSAVELFRKISDPTGLADAMRLMMHATRMKALSEKANGKGDIEKFMSDSEAQMKDELANFRETGNTRGQALMLLAVAEAEITMLGNDHLKEAIDCVDEAEELAEEVGELRLQALVALSKAAVLHAKHNFRGAGKAAKEATSLYNKLGDAKSEASASYSQGAAEINSGHVEEGMRCKAKSLKLWKDAGDKKLQSATLSSVAEFSLAEKEDAPAAIAAAKEALELSTALKDPAGASLARFWLIEAYIANGESEKAVTESTATLELAREASDKRELCEALQRVVAANLAKGDNDEAMNMANEAVDTAADLTDKRWQARALETLAAVYNAINDFETAKAKMTEAVDIMKSLKGYEEEAFILMQALARLLVARSDYKEAQYTMETAKNLGRNADDRYLEGMAVLGLSSAHAFQGDLSKGLQAANLARELFHEESYIRGEGRALKAQCEIATMMGDSAGAVKAANEGAALMQDSGDNKSAALLKAALASSYMAVDKASDAAKAAMDALKLARMEDSKKTTVQMIFLVLECNNAVLMESASDEKQIKAFKAGCEKMLRLAKEATGLGVKMADAGTEAAANFWVAHLNLMIGEVKESLSVAEKAKKLSKESKDAGTECRLLVLTAHCHLAFSDQSAAMAALNDAVAVEGADSEATSMASALLESIAGSQQQMQMTPAMMQQMMQMGGGGGGGGGGGASEAQVDVFKAPDPMMVRQYIMGLVQNMTGSSDEIDGDTPLMESGIDSLASVELRTQLQSEFKLNLPSTVMFNYPTISTMTRLLVDECTTKKISWG
jgi:tetratricopeptide (TPR) repeat protein/acyl carrier protein